MRSMLTSLVVAAAVGLAGACGMILEIAGGYALAPAFGTGLHAWSAMITVALAGLAAGYALGGLAADVGGRRRAGGLLAGSLAVAGLACAADALLWHRLVERFASAGLTTGPLLAAGSLFAVPFVLIGAVYPLAVKLRTEAVDQVGRRAGLLSAVSALGSVGGAAAAGFVLVPNLALETVMGLAAGTLLAAGAIVAVLFGGRRAGPLAALAMALTAAGAIHAPARPLEAGVLCRRPSLFGPAEVVDRGPLRYLLVSGTVQAMAWKDQDFRAAYPYVEIIAETLKENGLLGEPVLLIGLGAGLLPRALPPGTCHSVEVDPTIVELAERYFAFDRSACPVSVADGRAFLRRGERTYPAIVLDAYGGWDYPTHLLTRECFELIRRRLKGDGLLIVNFQGYLSGPSDTLLRSLEKTLRGVFPRLDIIAWRERGDYGDAILVARAADVSFDWPERPLRQSGCYEPVSSFLDDRPAQPLSDSRNPVALWSARANQVRRQRPWLTD